MTWTLPGERSPSRLGSSRSTPSTNLKKAQRQSAHDQRLIMRIAISGAGVAGAALAYWLHGIGHEPTLIKQAPSFRIGGYMIDFCGGSAMTLTNAWASSSPSATPARTFTGCGRSAMTAAPSRRQRRRHWSHHGERVGQPSTWRSGEGDLRDIGDTTEVIFDDSISALDQDGDGVHVMFVGNPPRTFDLFVSADGLHSTVRRLVFGSERRFEHYLGCKVAACVVDSNGPSG